MLTHTRISYWGNPNALLRMEITRADNGKLWGLRGRVDTDSFHYSFKIKPRAFATFIDAPDRAIVKHVARFLGIKEELKSIRTQRGAKKS